MKERNGKRLMKDIVLGMIGGLAGTYLMDKVTTLMYRYESDETKKRETVLMKEPAYTVLARRAAKKAGVALSDDEAAKAGNAFHWSYGIAWGGVYGALYERAPAFSKAAGLPYGATVFAVGDEGLNTALHVAPPPQDFPLAVHLRGLVGHAVYAATVDAVYRALKRITK